jgi:hypothetical protein
MNTSCRYCVFKQVEQTIQYSCALDRINKFKQHGTTVEQVRDEDLTYFLIKDRFCNTLRSEVWARKQADPIEAVKREVQLQADIIILIDDFISNDITSIRQTIQSAVKQTLLPKTIRLVADKRVSNLTEIYDSLANLAQSIPNYLHHIEIDTIQNMQRIDIAADKCESVYYTVFYVPFIIPPTFLANINDALFNLDKFVLLEPNKDNGNGLVVQTQLHKILLGNKPVKLKQYIDGELTGDNIIDKAKFFAKKEGKKYMIKKVSEICQEM